MRLHELSYNGIRIIYITGVPEWVTEGGISEGMFGTWPDLHFGDPAKPMKPGAGLMEQMQNGNTILFSTQLSQLLQPYKYEDLTVLGFIENLPMLQELLNHVKSSMPPEIAKDIFGLPTKTFAIGHKFNETFNGSPDLPKITFYEQTDPADRWNRFIAGYLKVEPFALKYFSEGGSELP